MRRKHRFSNSRVIAPDVQEADVVIRGHGAEVGACHVRHADEITGPGTVQHFHHRVDTATPTNPARAANVQAA